MSTKDFSPRVSLSLLFLIMVGSVAAFAGSAVIGSVAGSMNATIGGQAIMPNTTIFSGDSLQVNDGAAVVAIGNTSRIVFGRDTSASFLRDANEVTVLLSQGNVSVYQLNEGLALRVKAGDVSVVPAKGFKTLGDVAMADGAVVITAKEGSLRVEGDGPAIEVPQGKTIRLSAKLARASTGRLGGARGVVKSSKLLPTALVAVGSAGTGALAAKLTDKELDKETLAVACAVGNSVNNLAVDEGIPASPSLPFTPPPACFK